VTEQYLLYTPDVYQLSQATTSNPHFMWYDIQCSKGKKNVDRMIKFRIDQKEHELMYRMAPCAGIKRCPEPGVIIFVQSKTGLSVPSMDNS